MEGEVAQHIKWKRIIIAIFGASLVFAIIGIPLVVVGALENGDNAKRSIGIAFTCSSFVILGLAAFLTERYWVCYNFDHTLQGAIVGQ